MAGPDISIANGSVWNATTNTLKVGLDDVVISVAGGAHAIQLTDAAGLLWSGPGTISTSCPLTRYYGGTPGTPGTFDVAAAEFVGAGGDGAEITDADFTLALDHAAPITRTDLTAVYTAITQFHADSDFSSMSVNELADFFALFNRLFKAPESSSQGIMLQSTRALTQANALLTALEKYDQSSKDPSAYTELLRARQALKAAMPTAATFPFAITSTGT